MERIPASYPIHFISGLPRSGSTLLAALLRQNSRFHAGVTSPVGGLLNQLLISMGEDNEFSAFISEQQKRDILQGIFVAYYQEQIAKSQIIFDTNRLWCSKLPLIGELFPNAKVICCVRNIAWVMDSLERSIRTNTFEISKMFNHREELATVYSRTEALSRGDRLVGFAYNAVKEAFYSEEADRLLIVDYELLTRGPKETLSLIYQFIGEEPFEHDVDNLEYGAPELDRWLNTPGLHQIRPKVEFQPRRTILPPDLFEEYSQLSFWQDTTGSKVHAIRAQPVEKL